MFWRRSICLSFSSCCTHFPIFWIFPMACSKWLLEKHSIARQAFFAIGYRSRPKEPDSLQPSWADFHASCHLGQNCCHWTGDINLCTLFPIKHCRHRPPQAFGMRFGSRFLQIETEKQNFPHMLFFSKKLDMITKEKMYVVWNCWWCALINFDRCQTHKKKCAQGSFVRSLMPSMSKQRI